MAVGNETGIIGPGSVVIIAADTSHSVKALIECYVIDVFYPVKEDYM